MNENGEVPEPRLSLAKGIPPRLVDPIIKSRVSGLIGHKQIIPALLVAEKKRPSLVSQGQMTSQRSPALTVWKGDMMNMRLVLM